MIPQIELSRNIEELHRVAEVEIINGIDIPKGTQYSTTEPIT